MYNEMRCRSKNINFRKLIVILSQIQKQIRLLFIVSYICKIDYFSHKFILIFKKVFLPPIKLS